MTFPRTISLAREGVPFVTLHAAYSWASNRAGRDGRRRRVVYRTIEGTYPYRRWVVLPA